MAQINPKVTIRSVHFGMLLLSAAVIIFTFRLTIASDLDSLKAAAEQGDATAQFNLGYMYDNGRGVPQNYTEAERWYRMAAEQGNATAQANLGHMYGTGEGVPKNDIEAERWYRMAAEQGNAWAQANLGHMYYNNEGIPKDYVQAYAWFNIAAAQGEKTAKKKLKYIKMVMSTADIAKAQELSLEYWEAYGPNRASSE